jgi:hypothetical protein
VETDKTETTPHGHGPAFLRLAVASYTPYHTLLKASDLDLLSILLDIQHIKSGQVSKAPQLLHSAKGASSDYREAEFRAVRSLCKALRLLKASRRVVSYLLLSLR